MKFKTNISKQDVNLIGKASFSEAILKMLSGRQPDEKEIELFNAVLVSAMDNGIEAPSVFVPRIIVSTGNSMNASLAAGLLAIGDFHGGAIEACANLLLSGENARMIVSSVLTKGERISGYGHKVYKDSDPRVATIYEVANRLGKMGKYINLAREVEKELEKQFGKKLPLNIDGAIAACMCELGLDVRYGKAIFALARLPAMATHVLEELDLDKPYRRLEESDII